MVDEPPETMAPPAQAAGSRGAAWLRAIAYACFMYYLIRFVQTLRPEEEYLLFKTVEDRFVQRPFSGGSGGVHDVRRISDVWAFGNEVLLPGLFGGNGPCAEVVGRAGHFRSFERSGTTDIAGALAAKGCNDDVMHDGDGRDATLGASRPTVDEYLARLDQADWTTGLLIRQVRVQGVPSPRQHGARLRDASTDRCSLVDGRLCLLEMNEGGTSSAPFGRNWTHPREPLNRPFVHHSEDFLGSRPVRLSDRASSLTIPGGGYVAGVIPFFSDVLLPEQRGEAHEIVDFRRHVSSGFHGEARASCDPDAPELASSAGAADCRPRFMCARITHNGRHVHQLCDPGDAEGRITGVVRAAAEEWWNDLKRSRFVDEQTRALTVTLQLRANHLRLASYASLTWQFSSTGAVLPSSRVHVVPLTVNSARFYASWTLTFFGLVQFFELVELSRVGLRMYFSRPSGWLEVASVVLCSYVGVHVASADLDVHAGRLDPCPFLDGFGLYDGWSLVDAHAQLRERVAWLLALQTLKLLAYLCHPWPRVGRTPRVLAAASADVLALCAAVGIGLLALSPLFYVQLGSSMSEYADPRATLESLLRAALGDLDVALILQRAPSPGSATAALGALFVGMVLLLSALIAIVGDAHARVRREAAAQARWQEIDLGASGERDADSAADLMRWTEMDLVKRVQRLERLTPRPSSHRSPNQSRA